METSDVWKQLETITYRFAVVPSSESRLLTESGIDGVFRRGYHPLFEDIEPASGIAGSGHEAGPAR